LSFIQKYRIQSFVPNGALKFDTGIKFYRHFITNGIEFHRAYYPAALLLDYQTKL